MSFEKEGKNHISFETISIAEEGPIYLPNSVLSNIFMEKGGGLSGERNREEKGEGVKVRKSIPENQRPAETPQNQQGYIHHL